MNADWISCHWAVAFIGLSILLITLCKYDCVEVKLSENSSAFRCDGQYNTEQKGYCIFV